MFWIPEDSYLQILGGIYTDEDYSEVTSAFFDYLCTEFPGYKQYFNITKEHRSALKFMNTSNFKLLEEAELYTLTNFDGFTLNDNTEFLSPVNQEVILDNLDAIMSEDTYWNVERLRDNLERFIIIGYYDVNIRGALYAQIYEDNTVEIYGNSAPSIEILKSLMETLACKCKEINAPELILYSWDIEELTLAQELGYQYSDSNLCFMRG